MEDHAYSFYCKDKVWERCDRENLEVVKMLSESHDDEGTLTERTAVYRCRACGGFYKQNYRAIYYPSHLFDTEEGWSVTDKYFRIEEPACKTLHSALTVPLTIEEARAHGYAGEDRSWKNGHCNFPAQNAELTCRAADLQFVAYRSPDSKNRLSDKFYKCRRCGKWYFFTLQEPYAEAFLKPSNPAFPFFEARAFGY